MSNLPFGRSEQNSRRTAKPSDDDNNNNIGRFRFRNFSKYALVSMSETNDWFLGEHSGNILWTAFWYRIKFVVLWNPLRKIAPSLTFVHNTLSSFFPHCRNLYITKQSVHTRKQYRSSWLFWINLYESTSLQPYWRLYPQHYVTTDTTTYGPAITMFVSCAEEALL